MQHTQNKKGIMRRAFGAVFGKVGPITSPDVVAKSSLSKPSVYPYFNIMLLSVSD